MTPQTMALGRFRAGRATFGSWGISLSRHDAMGVPEYNSPRHNTGPTKRTGYIVFGKKVYRVEVGSDDFFIQEFSTEQEAEKWVKDKLSPPEDKLNPWWAR